MYVKINVFIKNNGFLKKYFKNKSYYILHILAGYIIDAYIFYFLLYIISCIFIQQFLNIFCILLLSTKITDNSYKIKYNFYDIILF